MDLSGFFSSYPGIYIYQAFCHSLIAAIIVDRAINAWKIDNPLVRQRFSIVVIILPIFSFPLYQIINSERGSISFKLGAIFDMNRWLTLELFGKFQLGVIFAGILLITGIVSFSQEIVPILIHIFRSRGSVCGVERPDDESVLSTILENMPGEKPEVFVIEDSEPILFSTTGRKAAVFLSVGLINTLNNEQLQAALAHEAAHIARSRRPLLIIVFIMRTLMFFNPIALMEFRRTVQEEEKICDDMAVSLTQNSHALAETLKRFYRKVEEINLGHLKKPSTLGIKLEDFSHNMHIENRVVRLEKGLAQKTDDEWVKFIITLIVIMVINYFVV